MLDKIFLCVLDMTRDASLVILVVLLFRLFLKRAPKIFSYALWAVVFFRLLCPFVPEASIGLVPEMTPVFQNYSLADESISFLGAGEAAYRAVGDALNGGLGTQYIRTTQQSALGMTKYVTSSWWEVWPLFGKYLWLTGVFLMFAVNIFSYGKLRRKLSFALPLEDGVYYAEGISSPFVIGLFRPRIYLPYGLEQTEEEYILLHERQHLRRLDPLAKLLGFTALCIHWFNPLVWLSFRLAVKDMEMSCDEAVIRELGEDIRADYSASLLALTTGKRYSGTLLSFDEGSPRDRIINLAKWKRPAVWVILTGTVLCIALSVCLLFNRSVRDTLKWARQLRAEEIAAVDVTYYAAAQTVSARQTSQEVIWAIVNLVQKSSGTYLENPEEFEGTRLELTITMQDGTTHTVSNCGNEYLQIDQDYFNAPYEWLSGWGAIQDYAYTQASADQTIPDENPAGGRQDSDDAAFWASLPKEYMLSSGSGAWSTDLHLKEDGSFTGEYSDYDMGISSARICRFSGRFGTPRQLDAFTWALSIESLTQEGTPGETAAINGTFYTTATPYGLDGTEELLLYLPGGATADLPEDFFHWMNTWRWCLPGGYDQPFPDIFPFYGLYNADQGLSFVAVTDDYTRALNALEEY